MPTAWESFFAMFSQFFAPLMDRGVAHAQIAGHLDDRLAAGLCQAHRFSLELQCVGLLYFLHDPFPPLRIRRVYPKLFLFHNFGAGSLPKRWLHLSSAFLVAFRFYEPYLAGIPCHL